MEEKQPRSENESGAVEAPWPPPVVSLPTGGHAVGDGPDSDGQPHQDRNVLPDEDRPEAAPSATGPDNGDGNVGLAPEAPSPRRRRRRSVAVTLIVVAVTLVAALVTTGVVVVLTRRSGPSYPSTWDPRLSALVSFVEKEKAARFEHPVRVVYLDEAEFKERLSVDEGLSDEDRKDVERGEAVLRALGLQGGKGSLVDQVNTLSTEATAAYYDPDRKEIVVPQTDGQSLATKATLVHELTHALQDQLDQIQDLQDSDAAAGLDALIEGEAEHIETAWTEALNDEERQMLDEQQANRSDDAAKDLEEVNPAMVAIFSAPYTIGEAMVEVLDKENQLADAFDDPPNSSADVLDPARWLDPVEAIHVEAPSLRDDEEGQGEDDTLGAHTLYLMLVSVLDPADALQAVGGWSGDRMRFYRAADETNCVRVALAGVDSAATALLGDALKTWVASRPEGAASSSTTDRRVEFDACDRGNPTEALTTDLANLPAIRASLVPVITDAGADVETAACVATQVIDRAPSELLSSDALTDEQQQQLRDAFVDARDGCLSPSG
jgi:hypothetical protein